VPLGIGIGLMVAALIAVEWQYGYFVPYTYCPYNFFEMRGAAMKASQAVNIHYWAFGYFAVFTVASYLIYIFKKEKG
jgi:hypothetical protein